MAEFRLPEQRLAFEQTAATSEAGTHIERVDAHGVPAEWVIAPGVTGGAVLLSLHGGAYSLGSLPTNRRFSALLSAATNRRVLFIDYRLAPEHRFPAALEDSLSAYDWLLSQSISAGDIAVAGNSAGGGLALATVIALRDEHRLRPGAVIALSAWTDLTGSGDSVTSCASTDFMLTAHGLQSSAAMYVDQAQYRNPDASPLFADSTSCLRFSCKLVTPRSCAMTRHDSQNEPVSTAST